MRNHFDNKGQVKDLYPSDKEFYKNGVGRIYRQISGCSGLNNVYYPQKFQSFFFEATSLKPHLTL